LHLSIKEAASSSNFALVKFKSKCLGPSGVAVIKGKFISLWVAFESSIFAFSAASVSLCKACLSCLRSIPSFDLNVLAKWSTIHLSKSSPPRWVSPDVDKTSVTPSPASITETSNVPPPKSKTKTLLEELFSKP